VVRTARGLGKGGFTMTEVIVVMAVMGILALGGSKLMQQIQDYFMTNRARQVTQQESRNAMGIITKDLRQAMQSTIAIANDPGQPPFSRIRFRKISDTGVGEPGEDVVFVQQGRELLRLSGGKKVTLSRNLRNASFAFSRSDSRDLITLSLTMERRTFKGKSKTLYMASESIGVMNQ
jgi:prepilin-type N-terminal cleavage/methylation domain-containing protein